MPNRRGFLYAAMASLLAAPFGVEAEQAAEAELGERM